MIRKIYSCFIPVLMLGITFVNMQAAYGQTNVKTDSTGYPWLHQELNQIQFYNKSALAKFYKKWSKNNANTITIAHLGDSHVQPDIYSGELRKILQSIKGDAGRGMIFPFSIAKTYSANDYKSTYTGVWKCAKSIEYAPKLPLGASGATCLTFDSHASFTFFFNDTLDASYRILKIFCKKSEKSFDFIVKYGDREIMVTVDSFVCPDQPYIEIELPAAPGNTITVQLVKQNAHESEFEFYGMSLESTHRDGLMLHCLGIGGAMYRSILSQKLFQEQLPYLNPDLVIVDFGTNDYIYKDEIPDHMESEIKSVLAKVRASAPNADLLLTTTQDMNRKGKNLVSGEAFSDLIKKIAKDENCAFYDWFWVSGGPRTMTLWHDRGLSQNDMIHLSSAGYKLKGQLLADAFIKTLKEYPRFKATDSLIFPVDSLKSMARRIADTITESVIVAPTINKTKKTTVPAGYKIIQHTIKSGETLSEIAQKYHVTVSSIMSLNGLKSSTIRAGKILKIKVKKR
jgi:lysophospholipase L1-like esterase